MTALSVNLNKVATIRNTRALGIPSVLKAASICLQAGANGITVHPRPDERHIRASDVSELSEFLKDKPGIEFNIEGNPFHNLMDFVRRFRPEQVTFVPDDQTQMTSDHGWRFPQDLESLRPLVQEALGLGVRVSLFMDAVPEQMHFVSQLGAQRVELYTEPYASAYGTPKQTEVLEQFRVAAQSASDCIYISHHESALGRNPAAVLNWRHQSSYRASRSITHQSLAKSRSKRDWCIAAPRST